MLPKSRFFSVSRSFSVLTLAVTGAAFLFACASAPAASAKKKKTPIDPGDDFFADDPTSSEEGLSPTANPDSGAFTPASARPAPNNGSKDDAGTVTLPDGGGADSGTVQPKVYCS